MIVVMGLIGPKSSPKICSGLRNWPHGSRPVFEEVPR